MKKKFLKILIIGLFTLIVWVILYHTDSGKKIFTARLNELQWEQLQDFFGADEQTTGIIVDDSTPTNPFPESSLPSTTLQKRLDYYRASKAELWVNN